ncbi:hypothetical protein ACQCN2_09450 [Brevibacillus ginsengisoli]|uniref:hypothetical protein n=1 Tax=Brevibacillus ginsengisoli TaxID=363854 RepID=UPI003CF5E222
MMNYITCIFVHSARGTWSGRLVWDSIQENDERKSLGYTHGDVNGEIKTQYFEDTISNVVDMLLSQAQSFGIQFHPTMTPKIYYETNIEILKSFPLDKHLQFFVEAENTIRSW